MDCTFQDCTLKLPKQSKWTGEVLGIHYNPTEENEPNWWQRFTTWFWFGMKWRKNDI